MKDFINALMLIAIGCIVILIGGTARFILMPVIALYGMYESIKSREYIGILGWIYILICYAIVVLD